MQLKDPDENTTAPTDAIDDLLRADHPFSKIVPSIWIEFKESVWGKCLRPWEKEVEVNSGEPVEDFYPPDPVPGKTWVADVPGAIAKIWGLPSKRILMRSEYHEAEKAARVANEKHMDAFLVTGHPGIGSLPSRSIPCRI
jgi:hypothetical protein